ncbi:MAG: hypothetical protein GKR96_06555 [Gammaproteobacteria bacterium]|nr:hypothetical protein [Gammaproteobacteria bacterium]
MKLKYRMCDALVDVQSLSSISTMSETGRFMMFRKKEEAVYNQLHLGLGVLSRLPSVLSAAASWSVWSELAHC